MSAKRTNKSLRMAAYMSSGRRVPGIRKARPVRRQQLDDRIRQHFKETGLKPFGTKQAPVEPVI